MKKVCVYCGLSSGKNPLYLEEAKNLARELVKRDLTLVYGGANVGLMGAIADLILEAGGRVIGVVPKYINGKFPEMVREGLTELHLANSMHDRKALMFDLSDVFIALPGGIGTLEEILEILTWAKLGLHHKSCG
ncbi:MAG: TIGR00730 family Rossman fold protein, partial [Spirulina sp.]